MKTTIKVSLRGVELRRFNLGVLGLGAFVAAFFSAMFTSLPSTDIIFLKLMIMLIGGFAFTVGVVCKVNKNVAQSVSAVLMGLLFGGLLVVSSYVVNRAFGMVSSVQSQLTILAGVSEEFFFRGAVFGIFLIFNSALIALIATLPCSVIFAYFHANVYNVALAQVFAQLFVGGIILCLAFYSTRFIDTAISAHLFNNILALLKGG
jgi:membrane protease YdiL (CAAX protease family)